MSECIFPDCEKEGRYTIQFEGKEEKVCAEHYSLIILRQMKMEDII
jgi:hypothetical protein